MKRGQVTVFVIIGMILLLALMIFLSRPSDINDNALAFSIELGRLSPYFRECARISMLEANARFGLCDVTRNEYEKFLISRVNDCMNPFIYSLPRYIDVEKLEEPSATLVINDANAIVTIRYPVRLSTKADNFVFPDYVQKFEKITMIDGKDMSNVVSKDTNFMLSAPDGIVIKGPYGEKFSDIYMKLSDKNDVKGNDLEANLVYGIYPLGYYTDKPITIKFNIDKIAPWLTDRQDLKVAFQDPDSQEWAYLQDSTYRDGILEADTQYTTLFGIGKPKTYTGNSPPQTAGEGSAGSNFNTPAGTFEPVPGKVQEVFDGVKNDMGGTYPLIKNNACVPEGAFCFTGASRNCPNGDVAIYCNDKIYGMENGALNTLFRHELTHNLQQNNNCAYDTPKSEWGAEYYSGSSYYHFAINVNGVETEGLSAADVAKEMENAGCVKSEFLDAAFCKGGSVSTYTQKCNVEITGYN